MFWVTPVELRLVSRNKKLFVSLDFFCVVTRMCLVCFELLVLFERSVDVL